MQTDSESSSDAEFHEENAEDLSYADLDTIPDFTLSRAADLRALQLAHNSFASLPLTIALFKNLVRLDLSNNRLVAICEDIGYLHRLKTLEARNNRLTTDGVPKTLSDLRSLEVLNLSGNNFTDFPPPILKMEKIRKLYFGGNRLRELPGQIKQMARLEILYLGGNHLVEIPAEVGYLQNLSVLALCNNYIQTLPPTLLHLRQLRSLSLHNNNLSTLPPELVSLDLVELSLRNNPLVVRFVQGMVYNPPLLQELAGRCIKIEKIKYTPEDLPTELVKYLDEAHSCVNPKCKGVYFTSRIEHVKFVDFCGKYRLPLLQYLCSPKCTTSQPTVYLSSDTDTDEEDVSVAKMKKVHLGDIWKPENTAWREQEMTEL